MASKSKTGKPLPQRLSFNGKGYKKESCSSTEKAAKQKADSERAKGYKARVKKDPSTGKYCLFVRKSK